MDEKQFQEISSKLDTIIKLLTINSVEGKDPKKMVLVLSSMADILNENPSTVRNRLFRARKEASNEAASSEDKVSESKKQ